MTKILDSRTHSIYTTVSASRCLSHSNKSKDDLHLMLGGFSTDDRSAFFNVFTAQKNDGSNRSFDIRFQQTRIGELRVGISLKYSGYEGWTPDLVQGPRVTVRFYSHRSDPLREGREDLKSKLDSGTNNLKANSILLSSAFSACLVVYFMYAPTPASAQ